MEDTTQDYDIEANIGDALEIEEELEGVSKCLFRLKLVLMDFLKREVGSQSTQSTLLEERTKMVHLRFIEGLVNSML